MNALFEQIWERKFVFLGTFFVVFTFSYILLLAIDFVPEEPATTQDQSKIEEQSADGEVENRANDEDSQATTSSSVNSEESEQTQAVVATDPQTVLPTSILIKKFNKTIPVLNPNSRAIAELDAALLDGVVRHPDSATLAQEGTVFILGHSSYLPQVFNKNFQAFNGIQDLEWGDLIEVYSMDTVYEYRVEKVYRARAQDLTVPIAGNEKLLTLATCNSFGTVDDRYIVEAKQTSARSL
ncbi:MAG: sortase [Candidatus Pacebacteria bacterium]|nr:sortase [Candidatus Paceibacterota bacterium]